MSAGSRGLAVVLCAVSGAVAAQPRWQQVASSGPEARDDFGMAFDEARGVTVLFGGAGSTLYADTWVWDGGTWQKLDPPSSPGAREAMSLAYDAARQRVVMFGGWDGGAYYRDTWEWNGVTWTSPPSANSPPSGRDNYGLAYEATRGVTLLFGGAEPGLIIKSDTWAWDGGTWAQLPVTAPLTGRFRHRLLGVGVAVLTFGGQEAPTLDDTWLLASASTGWAPAPGSTGIRPSARHSYGAAFDPARTVMVLFGGSAGFPGVAMGDTWEYDGVAWTRTYRDAGPSPRCKHAMVYDSVRQRVVLFGGDPVFSADGGTLGDTWEYGVGFVSAFDAGIDAGVDAGSSAGDGGFTPPTDAGSPPAALQLAVGCGCDQAGGSLVLLTMVLARRRRSQLESPPA